MKKSVIIIILTSLFLTGCSIAMGDVVEIEVVNLITGEKTVIAKDSEDASIILSGLNRKSKTNDSFSHLLNYEIILKKDKGMRNYKLAFDLDNQSVYFIENNGEYKIKDNSAKKMLLSNVFSYIYVDETIYDGHVVLDGKKYSPQIEYNWNVKNIDGYFINSTGILRGNYEKKNKFHISNNSIDLEFEKIPDNQTIAVYSGENLVSSGRNIREVLDRLQSDGEYIVECESRWLLKDNDFYGSQQLKFSLEIDRPATINVVTKENFPGNILLVSVENLNEDETIVLNTEVVKTENAIYSYGDKHYFIYPIDLYAQPGDYQLTAVVNEGREDEYILEETLTISNKTFKTQYLTVSEEMNETNNDNKAIYEFAQLVKPARTRSIKEKLWEGTFIMPVEGRITTDFAEIRYVNDEPSSSRHSGLDLAAPIGTPIKAPNKGLVVFSMEGLLSPGNTVVIDHGMGLFTSYYHLDTINVEKGQEVKKGDIIATVGTTGFSTGPHLHYAVSIYNSYVNPYQVLSGVID
ncbi:MAG: M23 family metallopeptidase [Tissierellia bacterium]|nr:M23 family metallopeptidase [Tissierellia bacterium]